MTLTPAIRAERGIRSPQWRSRLQRQRPRLERHWDSAGRCHRADQPYADRVRRRRAEARSTRTPAARPCASSTSAADAVYYTRRRDSVTTIDRSTAHAIQLPARRALRVAPRCYGSGPPRRATASGASSGSRSPNPSRRSAFRFPTRRSRRCGRISTTSTSTAVAAYERRFRHDVMAHVHAFGDVAPAAKPFIHLGATSAFVTDNADLILMRRGLDLLRGRLITALARARGVRARVAGRADARLHASPAGAAHDRRQARDALDAGSRARPRWTSTTAARRCRFAA